MDMLSRVADSLYWMSRYLERAEATARLIASHIGSRLDRNLLTVSTGEAFFGSVTLNLGPDAQLWAVRLRGLEREVT